jgi:hypothetical protein
LILKHITERKEGQRAQSDFLLPRAQAGEFHSLPECRIKGLLKISDAAGQLFGVRELAPAFLRRRLLRRVMSTMSFGKSKAAASRRTPSRHVECGSLLPPFCDAACCGE